MIRVRQLVIATVVVATATAAMLAGTADAAPKPKALPVYPVSVLNPHGDVAYSVPGASFAVFDCVLRDAGTYLSTYSSGALPPSGVWVYGTAGVPGSGYGQPGTVQCQGRAVTTLGKRSTLTGYLAYWEFTP